MSRNRKQLNIEVTPVRERLLLHLANKTESVSTNGLNKGQPSVGALMRRISEGSVKLYYKGNIINIPFLTMLEVVHEKKINS
jgi:hypothetical protein